MIEQFHSWAYIWKKKNIIQKDMYNPMFLAALFTIAKTWKQPKCPDWQMNVKEELIHTHTHIYVYIYIYTYVHVYMCVRVYMYISRQMVTVTMKLKDTCSLEENLWQT